MTAPARPDLDAIKAAHADHGLVFKREDCYLCALVAWCEALEAEFRTLLEALEARDADAGMRLLRRLDALLPPPAPR